MDYLSKDSSVPSLSALLAFFSAVLPRTASIVGSTLPLLFVVDPTGSVSADAAMLSRGLFQYLYERLAQH